MRHMLWIATLIAFTQFMPIAHAQSTGGVGAGGAASSVPSVQPNPTNCGTPDEPKPCTTPVPRKALETYTWAQGTERLECRLHV